jgi:hypothetical protein
MSSSEILKRIETLRREIEYLKRDLIQTVGKGKPKPSLFGSVRAGDITDEMIGEAKKSLFRELEDIQ